jgi:hypothetical protein
MDQGIGIMRHFLASIAYHATKAIKEAPENYPELKIGHGIRSPKQILNHMTGVLSYAHSFFERYETTHFKYKPWKEEVAHFYRILAKLDRSMSENPPLNMIFERLLQGPLSDAMAHTGQLLMLRRFAGAPVQGENFIMADIRLGIVGPNQPEPIAPD